MYDQNIQLTIRNMENIRIKKFVNIITLSMHVVVILIINSIHLSSIDAVKISNLIPHYCDQNIDTKPINNVNEHYQHHTIELNLTEPKWTSFLNLGASILQGVDVPDNYQCQLIVSSPANTGLILTFRKALLNEQDVITFRSGSNPRQQVWNNETREGSRYKEVLTLVDRSNPSAIIIKYEPAAGVSPFDAGFDLAITLYQEKDIHCGDNYDCNNGRCIEPSLQCDGYNNCGNDLDEYNCPGQLSWWMVGMLIPIAIIVVVLAIFVWIRMSKG
ncbi:Suppressor of tumorigenicity 14 protein [Dermatophagoides farinae]|uniref:Suppressor of tumorigenicity 14 protein n=1 Tax=Dermatophagoides farinae TaxID=6954 RepID=A0A922HPJ3_DERFA|nr:Suppressor of tumorigenicity 14 protein [Dermatophagoides farinae]